MIPAGVAAATSIRNAASLPPWARGRPALQLLLRVDGCRLRATPPSLRFLGPKVYIAAIVVLIAILLHGATARRMRELTKAIPAAPQRGNV
jgi:hypothetical protein